MAVTLEDVERLREKADISYEEAKAALERSNGDLLDALIDLERRGKTKNPGGGGTYSTLPGANVPPGPAAQRPGPEEERSGESGWNGLWSSIRELFGALFHALDPSTHNRFEVWRQGKMMTSMPLLILIIAVICVFYITVPLLVFGLLFGCRYQFSGPDLGRKDLNDAMNTVSDTVEGMKEQVRRSSRKP